MADKTKIGLKEQRERRKRVNRIKVGIILSIFVWMLLTVVVCVTLLVKVHSLEQQLDIIAKSSIQTDEVDNKENASANYHEYDEEEQTEQDVPTYLNNMNIMGTADKANLAQEGDELKVYLTFDDGPSSNTEKILDKLAEYNVKATFFVVGSDTEESVALYQRIVKEGHTLGMHSYSHKYSAIYDSLDGFKEDFEKIQNLLYDITGEECVYYRFPGGSSNQVSNTDMAEFISYLNSQEVTYYDWNVTSGDATSQAYTSDELVENVMKDVVKYKTSVVLLHDSENKNVTVEALGKILEALQNIDAQILPINEETTVIQHIMADSVQ